MSKVWSKIKQVLFGSSMGSAPDNRAWEQEQRDMRWLRRG